MPSIKLTTSEQTDRIIASGSTKTLIDTSITSTLTGYHAMGETVGRGSQTVLDVSQYRTIDLKASLTNVTGERYIGYRVYLYKSPSVTTGDHYDGNPDVLEMYDISFSTEGFTTIDASQAQGLAVIITTLRESDTFTALAIGSQRDFKSYETANSTTELLGQINENTKNSALIKSTSITSTLTGYHAIGETVGRGSQTVLDVRGFNSLLVQASKDYVDPKGSTECTVYLYDTYNVKSGEDLLRNPNLIGWHRIYLPDNGETVSKIVNVGFAQGAILVFNSLATGETGYGRLIGSRYDQRIRETIWYRKFNYSDLFTEDGTPKQSITNLPQLSEYKDLHLNAVSSYNTPLTVRVFETIDGVYGVSRYAGDKFTLEKEDSTVIPAIIGNTTLQFPLHRALRNLREGLIKPELRVNPTESYLSTDKVLIMRLTGVRHG